MDALTGPLAILGDETSIGLACALLNQDRTRNLVCRFEVDDVEASRLATTALGLDNAVLFGRTPEDAHLADMEAELAGLAAAGVSFALTGKAGTIQRLRQRLKRYAVPSGRVVAKAYWAPGKTGLD